MSAQLSVADKAGKMKTYMRLYRVRSFVETLGEFGSQTSDEDWASAYDLYYEQPVSQRLGPSV